MQPTPKVRDIWHEMRAKQGTVSIATVSFIFYSQLAVQPTHATYVVTLWACVEIAALQLGTQIHS